MQSAAFQLLKDDSHNFLKGMPPKAMASLRRQAIDMVLGTDMKQVGGRGGRDERRC